MLIKWTQAVCCHILKLLFVLTFRIVENFYANCTFDFLIVLEMFSLSIRMQKEVSLNLCGWMTRSLAHFFHIVVRSSVREIIMQSKSF